MEASRHLLDRRTFLRYGSTATAAATLAPALSNRLSPPVASPSFAWEEATIAELQDAMAAGPLTALALTRGYLQRIAAIDHDGPRLNSIIETNPDAEAVATALDAERAAGSVRGPLHGIPIVLKDNIATDDGMQTTAGSLALVGSRVPRDAGIAARLREAGAILLAKANMSEWTGFRGYPSKAAWSGRAGQGLNPYALGYTTGHSSSGSAAAVSANLAAGGIGTETYGSILMPSSLCGVVGLKPTLGLTSRSGVIPIAFSRDVTGPIGRTVADVATILGGMAGADPLDAMTERSAGHVESDYRTFLDTDGLRGARIGLWHGDDLWIESGEAKRIKLEAVDRLREAGATVIQGNRMDGIANAIGDHISVMFYEFEAGVDEYLAGLSESPVRTLAEVVAFNEAHADEELRWLNQSIMESALGLKDSFRDDPEYRRALRDSRIVARRMIDDVMAQHRLDALAAITYREAWAIDLLNGDPGEAGQGSAGPYNAAGYPCITVPAGSVGELPVGLSFMAEAWSEPKLLRLAHAFEQTGPSRRAPKLLDGYGQRDFVER